MALRKVCAAPGCDDLAVEDLAHCEDHEARRATKLAYRRSTAQLSDHAQAHRQLYKLKAWIVGRLQFLRRNPLCVDCAELGAVEPATDVDHIIPHKGDRRLFFDRSNWQALCKSCHSRKTAREVFHRRGDGMLTN
ncbi:5-methylcytosine-specific restriction enzyme A [Pseudosulfitobacter pseudonitzschiae]|uniref:Putative HNH nuclease YajD n=1 Tax=Pseudosulfitobacter pseudonitzschiae TaxID=1402135 RepID=A0A073J625_9RHOB|nr:HNH endonuclease signature motif containing protein [Pseudosulfitobacter pseudonitzschiae]KEJ97419.1 HNH endonuclease [Pseudosulfitobacter pseudonitzschiae]QKS08710.1 HNH endonuclease [Pseudosulfitobacter pseudonitzschiae]SHE71594.1 5-methylcytosine-specific restriction enzyme A [Pseudosulfitobacter pseudonitzschiae]